jgi:hypothetical protein
VGYDPHRRYRARTVDYVLVAAVILVALALVGWAFLG